MSIAEDVYGKEQHIACLLASKYPVVNECDYVQYAREDGHLQLAMEVNTRWSYSPR
jgi:hypothetical protein